MSLYYFDNARTPEQRAEMERLDGAGVCLFCPEHLVSHPRQEILFSTEHWNATTNAFPYPGTSLHLLLLPHQHVSDLLALTSEAQNDFWTALAEVDKRYSLTSYGVGVRNGDLRLSGATIAHLHVHVLVAANTDGAPTVRMRFSQ
ncbi:MAG TPA: HIT domain-containing protein [Streptosporangiaceae bacterium]|nr:HIT domain-containing protein [Streptosporangiaceae bacterium]